MQWYYEKYVRKTEHHPVERYQYNGAEIYISEGGPYYISDYPLDMRADLKKEFESEIGWYESMYALGKGDDIIVWQPLLFDFLHDTRTLTQESRVQGRINAAKRQAEQMVDSNPHLFETMN